MDLFCAFRVIAKLIRSKWQNRRRKRNNWSSLVTGQTRKIKIPKLFLYLYRTNVVFLM